MALFVIERNFAEQLDAAVHFIILVTVDDEEGVVGISRRPRHPLLDDAHAAEVEVNAVLCVRQLEPVARDVNYDGAVLAVAERRVPVPAVATAYAAILRYAIAIVRRRRSGCWSRRRSGYGPYR